MDFTESKAIFERIYSTLPVTFNLKSSTIVINKKRDMHYFEWMTPAGFSFSYFNAGIASIDNSPGSVCICIKKFKKRVDHLTSLLTIISDLPILNVEDSILFDKKG